MAPILELIKKNAVPVNVMRSAAIGALPIPAEETLEVLVYLTSNSLFGQDARMTLARWDAQSAMDVSAKIRPRRRCCFITGRRKTGGPA